MYTVTEWSPSVSGEDVGEYATVEAAAEAAAALYGAQVIAPEWGNGYVVKWDQGGASAKRFHGADRYGWGGDVPPTAQEMVEAITKLSPPAEEFCR